MPLSIYKSPRCVGRNGGHGQISRRGLLLFWGERGPSAGKAEGRPWCPWPQQLVNLGDLTGIPPSFY